MLFNQEPSELLDLFKKLESENLSLIQDCQQVRMLFVFLIVSIFLSGRGKAGGRKGCVCEDKIRTKPAGRES